MIRHSSRTSTAFATTTRSRWSSAGARALGRGRRGRRYFDALSAYSALLHPRLLAAAREQLDRLTLTSRAFRNDRLGEFCRRLAEAGSSDRVLPMNTGAEAVETAIKAARKWGYEVKGVAPTGRGSWCARATSTAARRPSSPSPTTRGALELGPYTPGFETTLRRSGGARGRARRRHGGLSGRPIQGEAGDLPPAGDLAAPVPRANVLMIADEIQSGLGRTGRTWACDHEEVTPTCCSSARRSAAGSCRSRRWSAPTRCSACSGPASTAARSAATLRVRGGDRGARPAGRRILERNATALGSQFSRSLREASHSGSRDIRQRGLWIGVDSTTARQPREVSASGYWPAECQGDAEAHDPVARRRQRPATNSNGCSSG